ncbi:MAG: hypothetical protein HQM08_18955 [Candidatus Riflebacteria bacterium]|nr:hypothetical protein [Candidatus Riflebacteria bacterium]
MFPLNCSYFIASSIAIFGLLRKKSVRYRFIDHVVNFKPNESFLGVKSVSFEEYDLKTPFGDSPKFPVILLVESLFQAAYWLEVLSSDFKSCAIADEFDSVTLFDSLRPGEKAFIEITILSRGKDHIIFQGSVKMENKKIATISNVHASLFPLEDFDDSSDLRTLFGEIYE